MSSVLDAGPCVRSNQLDFDDEVIFKATKYLYDHVRHRTDQPFCLTVAMTHPHDPYAMTKDFWDLYDDVEIPLPKTPAILHDQQDPHSKRILKCIDLYGREIPEERIRAARRAYFAACTYVDSQVGKLLETLEACGLTEDTIVVFTSDHGDMLGERGLWYKMVWYEMAARIPILVYAPGRYAARRVRENVSAMDLLPTFVEMAGGTVHPNLPLDGMSLMPYLLADGASKADSLKTDTVLGEYMAEGTLAPVVMIRRGPWKFIYSPIDPPMLFNLVADPTESTNLAAGIDLPTRSTPAAPNHQANPVSNPSALASLPSPHSSPTPYYLQVTSAYTRHLPTPPRTPQPHATVQPYITGTSQLLSQFLDEVRARWDFDALHQAVLTSQRRRRLVYAALGRGVATTWEYAPPVDAGKIFIRNRNQGLGVLGDVEWVTRWPRVGRSGEAV
jgi:choline-sulfatase